MDPIFFSPVLTKTPDNLIQVEVDTPDNEDHTFNGVMFTVECKTDLPVDFIQITSLAVRGGAWLRKDGVPAI